MSTPTPTLHGRDYRSDDVFRLECETIFRTEWMYVGREDQLAAPGDRVVAEVGGESILVVRNRDGDLRAFYNVCRHRGSMLCDAGGSGFGGAITCPYHAWSYSLDGALIATPRIAAEEVDRAQMPLWSVAIDSWQGFMFVCLADSPTPLMTWLAETPESPLQFDHIDFAGLRTGTVTTHRIRSNWKILVENYSECLHCPTVHPELVEIIPIYKTGLVVDPKRPDGGVALLEGVNAYTAIGSPPLPTITGMTEVDKTSYYGVAVFPNFWLDITGSVVTAGMLVAHSATETSLITEYLFPAETLDNPDHDISGVVKFTEIVSEQDNSVCERVQRGISSRAFTTGIYAPQDFIAYEFSRYYLQRRGPAE